MENDKKIIIGDKVIIRDTNSTYHNTTHVVEHIDNDGDIWISKWEWFKTCQCILAGELADAIYE